MASQCMDELSREIRELLTAMLDKLREEEESRVEVKQIVRVNLITESLDGMIATSESSTFSLPTMDEFLPSTEQIEATYVNGVIQEGPRQQQQHPASLFMTPKFVGNLREASWIPYDFWLPLEHLEPPVFHGGDSQNAWNQQLR